MKTEPTIKTSYSGMMDAHDFVMWYTYFTRRLKQGWRPDELSFLMGRPDHVYLDFEKIFQVPQFLLHEALLLDRIYACAQPIEMEFHRDDSFDGSEKRLVRLMIEEDEVKWSYKIVIPWKFSTKKDSTKKTTTKPPLLQFEEWKAENDLQLESDAMLHVRQRIDHLLDSGFFAQGAAPWQLFRKVEYTGQVHLQIFPRHLKNVLYSLIQQNKLVVRSVDRGYSFYLVDSEEERCII